MVRGRVKSQTYHVHGLFYLILTLLKHAFIWLNNGNSYFSLVAQGRPVGPALSPLAISGNMFFVILNRLELVPRPKSGPIFVY